MSTILNQDYVTVAEAAELVRVAPSSIRRWIKAGDLPAYRFGHHRVRIKRDELARLVAPLGIGGERNARVPNGTRMVVPPITPAQQRQALEAVEAAKRLQAELLARRGGVPFPNSWELINEARDKRSEQLQ